MNTLTECLLCGSTAHEPIDRHTIFGLPSEIVRCESCHFAFSTHQLDDSELFEFYSHLYRRQKQESLNGDRILGDLERAVSQLDFVGEALKPHHRILEVGGGWGINANFLYGRGYKDIVVNEFDDQIMRVLYPQITRIKQNVFEMDRTCDFIVMSHVLEHFYEPTSKLEHLRQLLRKDGHLFIEVPNCGNPELLRTSRRTFHYWFFDRAHVERLLLAAGFEVVKSQCFGKDQRISDLSHSEKLRVKSDVVKGKTSIRGMHDDDERALWVRLLARPKR